MELLATLSEKELLTEEMWEVVQDYFVSGYGSEWWNFILKHSDEYAKLVGKEAVANKIGSTMHSVRIRLSSWQPDFQQALRRYR